MTSVSKQARMRNALLPMNDDDIADRRFQIHVHGFNEPNNIREQRDIAFVEMEVAIDSSMKGICSLVSTVLAQVINEIVTLVIFLQKCLCAGMVGCDEQMC